MKRLPWPAAAAEEAHHRHTWLQGCLGECGLYFGISSGVYVVYILVCLPWHLIIFVLAWDEPRRKRTMPAEAKQAN